MSRRSPRVRLDTPIGADIDLETEDIRDRQGRRIDNAYAERVIAAASTVGRPTLSGTRNPSPHIGFRLPAEVRGRAEAVAARDGITVSALARQALIDRLEQAG